VNRYVLIVALAVAVSGCADPPGSGNTDGESLKIVEFDVSDSQMAPGQQARVTLELRNYNEGEIELNDVSLYNTAFLEVSGKTCSPETIRSAEEDFAPGMECSWTVTAPEDLSGFDSRSVSIQLNLDYSSELSNREQPIKVEFKDLEDIDSREEHSHSFSNGEVQVDVSYQNPVPNQGDIINFEVDSMGLGNVQSGYEMSYQPEKIFQECDNDIEPVVGDEASFSCEIPFGSASSATRNLVFSTSYKYVKSPSLDIEVVEP